MKKFAAGLFAAALAAGACQCWDPRTQSGTVLFVSVDNGGIEIDQLELSIPELGMKSLLRPEQVTVALVSPATVRLQLADSAAGTAVHVHVFGRRSGLRVSQGQSESVTVVLGYEVDANVTLAAYSDPDGGTGGGAGGGGGVGGGGGGMGGGPVDAGCAGSCKGCCNGETCELGDAGTACGKNGAACNTCAATDVCRNQACAGCNGQNCNDGCCTGSECVRGSAFAAGSCGTGGIACTACPAGTTDRCTAGMCKCGTHERCGTGQRCEAGQCVCDATSCPLGCCDPNGVCQTRSPTKCGVGGAACGMCPGETTNNCSLTGMCQCGSNAECGGGQRCQSGRCICDATSCASGCCDGDTCLTAGLASCGRMGLGCITCDPLSANRCSVNGDCECSNNGGAACGPGRHCTGSGCVCDAVSCPNGCCDANGVCQPGTSTMACGSGGEACVPCANCSNGTCPANCNPTTCSNGCCAGSNCRAPGTVTACGTAGSACVACNPVRANNCFGGSCSCGSGPQCGTGQFCDAGTCTCNAASCPNGCCNGNLCQVFDAGSFASCGSGGAACAACAPAKASACTSGACRCGNGPACGPGLSCDADAGQCVCNAGSGCGGCCSGNNCLDAGALTVTACGSNSMACTQCAAGKADNCAGGTCKCGNAAACGTGYKCSAGACVCDGFSCAGCCSANGMTCNTGNTATACGTSGNTCVDCTPRGDRCNNNGQCACGLLGSACNVGQTCAPFLGLIGCN